MAPKRTDVILSIHTYSRISRARYDWGKKKKTRELFYVVRRRVEEGGGVWTINMKMYVKEKLN